METEDRDTARGSAERQAPTNVVQFPRDWLGPRDELVPFGPSAYASPPDADAAGRGTSGVVVDLPADDSLTQDDFWGGELGAIPSPIVAPRPTAVPVATVVSRRSTVRARALALRAGVALPRLLPTGWFGGWARRWPAVVAGTAVLAGVAVAIDAGMTPSAHVATRHTAGLASAAALPLLPTAALQSIQIKVHFPSAEPRRDVTAGHRSHRRALRAPARGRLPHPASTTTYAHTSHVSSAPVIASSGSTAAASTGRGTSNYAPVTSSYAPVTTSTASHSTSRSASTRTVKAGPVGQGAPFGPGSLG